MVFRFSSASPVPFMAAALLMLAGCDTQSSDAGQDADAIAASENSAAADNGPPQHPAFSGKLDISQRGTPLPEAAFIGPDGSPVTLADFNDKPLLVNLWATWCAPCVAEMPTLDALAANENRLNVLVVSQDLEGNEKVTPFFEKAAFKKLKPYIDPENGLNIALATGIMPTTILYDRNGKEVWRMLGGMNWNSARAAAMMEDTLAGS